MNWVLGLDGGGTKTVCVLMHDTGEVLSRGEAGASNYQTIGKQAAFLSIQSAINQALASTDQIRIDAIGLGLAGVDRPRDIQVAQSFIDQLTLSNSLPITWALQPSTVVICNDALIALVGGLGHTVGIVAISGTGSIIFGQNHQGYKKRVGGWGSILGDEGSAYFIAVRGMQAALRAYDGRSKPTSLQERLKEHLNLSSLDHLIEVVYQRGWGVKQIAALAPIIDEAAASGDEVSASIIEDTVHELVRGTQVVIDAIFYPNELVEVVTTGSVWQSKSKIREKFETALLMRSPFAKVIFPRHEPAYGAGLLALNALREQFI